MNEYFEGYLMLMNILLDNVDNFECGYVDNLVNNSENTDFENTLIGYERYEENAANPHKTASIAEISNQYFIDDGYMGQNINDIVYDEKYVDNSVDNYNNEYFRSYNTAYEGLNRNMHSNNNFYDILSGYNPISENNSYRQYYEDYAYSDILHNNNYNDALNEDFYNYNNNYNDALNQSFYNNYNDILSRNTADYVNNYEKYYRENQYFNESILSQAQQLEENELSQIYSPNSFYNSDAQSIFQSFSDIGGIYSGADAVSKNYSSSEIRNGLKNYNDYYSSEDNKNISVSPNINISFGDVHQNSDINDIAEMLSRLITDEITASAEGLHY